MGFLLFAGGTLVAPTSKTGDLAGMAGFDGCRANGAEYKEKIWFQRIWRKPADGCLGGSNVFWFMQYFKSPDTFVVDQSLDAGATWNLTSSGQSYCKSAGKIGGVTCWAWNNGTAPEFQGTWETTGGGNETNPLNMAPITGKFDKQGVPLFAPKNLNKPWTQCSHPNVGNCNAEGFLDATLEEYECHYQCVKWKQLSVSSVIKVSGAVFTGAFFLTKIIEGWTSVMGYELITTNTNVQDLVRLLAVVRQYRTRNKCFGIMAIALRANLRRSACALLLGSFWLLSYLLAPRLNLDGFFTADYYTTLIFIFAGLVSLSQRYFNPYMCAPLLYTSNLWLKGVDSFVSPGEDGGVAKQKKISLYEWIHLLPDERSEFLFKYARCVSEDEVKKFPEDDLNAPERQVISVSYCVDSQSITDYALAKTVPRKLGVPHGVHGKIQKMKDGKYEIQWKRVIGCGSAKDLELEHVRYLVDPKKLATVGLEYNDDETLHDNLEVLRKALCGGEKNVGVLSEEGKAFIVGCALKWHVLTDEKGGSNTVQNLDVRTSDMQKWPAIYMKHMQKWQNIKETGKYTSPKTGITEEWKEYSHAPEELVKEAGLHWFWAGDPACRPDIKSDADHHPNDHRTIKKCRWEGCVEPFMVLESSAEWLAARRLLGLKSLKENMALEQKKAAQAKKKEREEKAATAASS
jgi:hypothetical protein